TRLTSGSKKLRTWRLLAMPNPRSTPTAMLATSPARARYSETARWRASSPEPMRSAPARHTEENVGRTCVPMMPLRVATSQPAITTASGAIAETARRALAAALMRGLVELEHLLAHLEPDAIAQARELFRGDDVLARPRAVEIDVDDALDPSGPRGHD